MKILFVSDLFPPIWVGGYEVNCSEMAGMLTERGHEVQVLTSAYQAEKAGARPGVYRELLLKTNLLRPKTPDVTGVGNNRLQVQLNNVRAIKRHIARFKPDVVVFWGCHELGRGMLSAAEETSRVVYWLADTWLTLELAIPLRPWYYQVPRRIYDIAGNVIGLPSGKVRTDNLIFVSHSLQAQYAQMGIDVSRSEVIRCGIPAEFCKPQPQHILSRQDNEPPRILYFGQLAQAKGTLTLVTAFGKLREMPGFEQARLTLLGGIHDPEFGAALKARIAALNLTDVVDFPERMPRRVTNGFRSHDLFAFPSEWEEPYALTLLEGMAAAMPVVASLRGGSKEIVRDGVNAVAFEAGNAADLAAKMSWVLHHPAEAAALGHAASLEIPQSSTLDVQVAALEAHLVKLTAAA